MAEYIERSAVLQNKTTMTEYDEGGWDAPVSVVRVEDIEAIPAADVVPVYRGEESVLSELKNDYKDFEKIKTHLAEIIVEGKVEMPYYSILWFDEENKEYNVGYSSYCLDYVRKWLELVFEVVDAPTIDAVPVKHGKWVNVQNGKGCCSECHRLDAIDPIATHCRYCGTRMGGEPNG